MGHEKAKVEDAVRRARNDVEKQQKQVEALFDRARQAQERIRRGGHSKVQQPKW